MKPKATQPLRDQRATKTGSCLKPKLNLNARKLVRALRSGTYKQGRNALHNVVENTYCCLGVACELFLKAGHKLDTSVKGKYMLYDGKVCVLPLRVRLWMGVHGANGAFDADSLTAKNDRGATFDKIADIIESKPNGLFVEGK